MEFRKLSLAGGSKTVIGMVHCLPLPGTVGFSGDFEKIVHQAVMDAETLEKAGVDAVIVENMGDVPFSAFLEKPQLAALAVVAREVSQRIHIPLGIDAAFNDCEASLSIASLVGASFIRVPVFVDTVLFSDGIIYPCARKCLQYRKQMGLERVQILADIQVKHAHMLNSSVSMIDSARDAVGNGADAIIITGEIIGDAAPIESLRKIKEIVSVPVLAGSGVKKDNIREQLEIADGCIVGSGLKEGGLISNPISYALTHDLVLAK